MTDELKKALEERIGRVAINPANATSMGIGAQWMHDHLQAEIDAAYNRGCEDTVTIMEKAIAVAHELRATKAQERKK